MIRDKREVLQSALEKLLAAVTLKEDELYQTEANPGTDGDAKKMHRLVKEIASLNGQIDRCLNLLEAVQ